MPRGVKFSKHHHSGKLRPHMYTSYVPLILLLLVTAIPLSAYTSFALSPGPDSQSISLSGTVPGKPPTVAPTIKNPLNGSRFSTSPITISGSCPAGTLVEIYKNDIFAGSTICAANGSYTTEVDLLIGANTLVARVYDDLNQAGPNSEQVNVFYDLLPAQAAGITPINFGGAQILLSTDAVFRGTFPEQELTMPLTILGGVPPFAINVQWGDGKNTVLSRSNNNPFSTGHVFLKPGTYQMSIQATDNDGRVAFLSVAAIVNGKPAALAGSGASGVGGGTFSGVLALWPLYVSLVAVVLSFWFGEMREKYVLTHVIHRQKYS